MIATHTEDSTEALTVAEVPQGKSFTLRYNKAAWRVFEAPGGWKIRHTIQGIRGGFTYGETLPLIDAMAFAAERKAYAERDFR